NFQGVAIYNPGERLIYCYFDGKTTRQADPLVLFKKQRQVWPELSTDLKVATSQLLGDKDTIPAHQRAVGLMRWIFDVKNFDDGGLTDSEIEDLLYHFLEYSDILKKDSPPSPTLSTPMGGLNGSSADDQHTLNSTDSGSVGGEPISNEPGPWPSGCKSPMVP
ncbi:MAG: hypothetical protein Q7O66_07900, partial [Dehalococcoidia bacterium]|nr:hypothetical protein [Dehalococcoidia bacterium]